MMTHPLKLLVLLGAMKAAQTASADLSVGLGDNIKSVTITEFIPQGRTVILSTPETIGPFVSGNDHLWTLYYSHKITRDFFNIFPVRYMVAVHGETNHGKKYDDLCYLAVMETAPEHREDGTFSEGEFHFVLYHKNQDDSFNLYREGPTRARSAPDTPLERYLTQLFPPRGTEAIHTAATRKPEMEENPAWFASCVTLCVTLPVWQLGTFVFSAAAAVCLAFMLRKRPQAARSGQAVPPEES